MAAATTTEEVVATTRRGGRIARRGRSSPAGAGRRW
jgi:hypothetical protein